MNLTRDELLHHFSSGLYAKEIRLPAGYSLGKHTHSFEHFSILAQGSVILTIDGVEQELTAPALVTIAAGSSHVIHSHTDTVWFCIHALSAEEFDSDTDRVDAILIAKGA